MKTQHLAILGAVGVSILTGCGGSVHPGRAPEVVRPLPGTVNDTSPAADRGYLAWTVGSERLPPTFTLYGAVYVRSGALKPYRVNPPGTKAMTGGIDGGRLVYAEFARDLGRIRLYDVRARRFLPLPSSVQARGPGIVWKPTLSGHLLLFGRFGDGWQILLSDLRTGRTTLLERNVRHAAYSVPGQINGRFAVWLSCSENACNVLELDVRSGRTWRLPIRDIYNHGIEGPSVAPDGTVYFGDGGLACGSDVVVYRYRRGHGIQTVARLQPGMDFQYSYAERLPKGVRVLIDRYDCRAKRFDIAAVFDPGG